MWILVVVGISLVAAAAFMAAEWWSLRCRLAGLRQRLRESTLASGDLSKIQLTVIFVRAQSWGMPGIKGQCDELDREIRSRCACSRERKPRMPELVPRADERAGRLRGN